MVSSGLLTTWTWSAPAAGHSSMTWPSTGWPPSGSIFLGTRWVKGLKQVLFPAAVTTAGMRGVVIYRPPVEQLGPESSVPQ
ncbi:hypothetical protein GCM10009642_38410 [Nocardiopsis metallicus]